MQFKIHSRLDSRLPKVMRGSENLKRMSFEVPLNSQKWVLLLLLLLLPWSHFKTVTQTNNSSCWDLKQSQMQLTCWCKFKNMVKIQHNGLLQPELCHLLWHFGYWQPAWICWQVSAGCLQLSAGSYRALKSEKMGFRGAPEEAKRVGEPSWEHL